MICEKIFILQNICRSPECITFSVAVRIIEVRMLAMPSFGLVLRGVVCNGNQHKGLRYP